MSCAGVAANDIRQGVVATAHEIMKKQRNEERALASVAVYGQPECSNDRADVNSVCFSIGCNVRIISMVLIGKPCQHQSALTRTQPRLLKVKLSRQGDRDKLLDAAKKLKGYQRYSQISISPWFAKADYAAIKC